MSDSVAPAETGAPAAAGGASAEALPAAAGDGKENGAAPDAAALQAQLTQERTAREAAEAAREQAVRDKASLSRYVVSFFSKLNEKEEPATDEAKQKEQFLERFQERPIETLDEIVAARLEPLERDKYSILATRDKQGAKAELTQFLKGRTAEADRLWAKYEAKTDAFLQGVPLDAQAKPGAYFAAMKMQMLPDLEEIARTLQAAQVESERQASLEGASGAPPRGAKTTVITAEDRHYAKQFGMTDDEWLKSKKEVFGE